MTGKCGKNQGKNYFSHTLGFDLKTRSQFRPAGKLQRDISKNKVKKPPPPPFVWKCGHSPFNISDGNIFRLLYYLFFIVLNI